MSKCKLESLEAALARGVQIKKIPRAEVLNAPPSVGECRLGVIHSPEEATSIARQRVAEAGGLQRALPEPEHTFW